MSQIYGRYRYKNKNILTKQVTLGLFDDKVILGLFSDSAGTPCLCSVANWLS
jgi:hypothetical protein